MNPPQKDHIYENTHFVHKILLLIATTSGQLELNGMLMSISTGALLGLRNPIMQFEKLKAKVWNLHRKHTQEGRGGGIGGAFLCMFCYIIKCWMSADALESHNWLLQYARAHGERLTTTILFFRSDLEPAEIIRRYHQPNSLWRGKVRPEGSLCANNAVTLIKSIWILNYARDFCVA